MSFESRVERSALLKKGDSTPISLETGVAGGELVNSRLRSLSQASAVLFSEVVPELGKDRACFFLKKKMHYIKME